MGLEPPGAVTARLAAATATAAALVDDALVRAAPALDFSGLGLEALPPSLAVCAAWLQHLDLSGCALTLGDLYPLGGLTALVTLSLADNLLAGVPAELGRLLPPCLEELELDGNALTALPPELGALSGLVWLSTARNRLTALAPEAVAGWPRLAYLNLRANDLTSLPPGLGDACPLLEELHVGHNALTALPLSLARCARLAALHAPHNALVGELLAVEAAPVADDGGGDVASTPPAETPTACWWPQLVQLDVSGNAGLSALPDAAVAGATRLTHLLAAGTTLTAVPPSLGAAAAGSLRVLSLAGNARLAALPPSLGALRALEEVHLGGCRALAALPPEVVTGWAAAPLACVALRDTGLRALPDGVAAWGGGGSCGGSADADGGGGSAGISCLRLLDLRASAKGRKDSVRVAPAVLAALAAAGTTVLGAVVPAGGGGAGKGKAGKPAAAT